MPLANDMLDRDPILIERRESSGSRSLLVRQPNDNHDLHGDTNIEGRIDRAAARICSSVIGMSANCLETLGIAIESLSR